jgi:environmental stress-induced protein Ves
MRVFRAAGHRVMPWKNGGGITTEIAIFPEDAALDAFDWRLSMATVSNSGPFSLFAGIDRTLAVLEGEGIALSVGGLQQATLTRASPPFSFPADRPASARLIAGQVVDLNVMTRRGRFVHRLERLSPGRSAVEPRRGALMIAFCARGSAILASGSERMTLATHDAALIDAACEIVVDDKSGLYAVTLHGPA